MTIKSSVGRASGFGTMTAKIDTRYSFVGQFLWSSAIFSRRCSELEKAHKGKIDNQSLAEHRGLVTAIIMQCVAAVEAEVSETLRHGPGSYLGSNGMDKLGHAQLAPFREAIESQRTLEQYNLILHILGKPVLPKGQGPWQEMQLLIRLRNELVHYKSRFGNEMSQNNLLKALRQLNFKGPSFIHPNSDFFPHQILHADCAKWAIRSTIAFLNAFYAQLGIESRLKSYIQHFESL